MCLTNIHVYINISISVQFSSVSQLCSTLCWPHEPQHTRPPCPSPTPRVHSNLCSSSQWCHPAISFSIVPFSSCPQSLLASGSFPMSQFFAWGGQSTVASASVRPVNAQDCISIYICIYDKYTFISYIYCFVWQLKAIQQKFTLMETILTHKFINYFHFILKISIFYLNFIRLLFPLGDLP